MIIKYFGKLKAKEEGQPDPDGDAKIEFMTLIEPLVLVISRPEDNGPKLTGLALMSIVNMCNFSEDIIDIYLQLDGHFHIMNLLENKDDEIILNTMRLIMTLIKKNTGDEAARGKYMVDFNDFSLIYRIKNLIMFGTQINGTNFSKNTIFMALSLLRAFIGHSKKDVIGILMENAFSGNALKPAHHGGLIKELVELINPRTIHMINKDIECAVLAILNLICKEEVDLKVKIGGPFLLSAALRLDHLKKFEAAQRAIDWHMEKNQMKKVREIMEDPEKIHEQIQFQVDDSPSSEEKFFKLIETLTLKGDGCEGNKKYFEKKPEFLKSIVEHWEGLRERIAEAKVEKDREL